MSLVCIAAALVIVWWFGRDTYIVSIEQYEQQIEETGPINTTKVLDEMLASPDDGKSDEIKIAELQTLKNLLAGTSSADSEPSDETQVQSGTPQANEQRTEEREREKQKELDDLSSLLGN